MSEFEPENLQQKLNLETGQISWEEIQRHFARGSVIVVAGELDLVEVASAVAEDNKRLVEEWMNSGQVTRANDDHGLRWAEMNPPPNFWAVVVAPWVLVQEMSIH